MKKALIILCGVFGLTLSLPSQAEWTHIAESVDGDAFYVDLTTVKQGDGNVYAWTMSDFREPLSYGVLSSNSYKEIICDTPVRLRSLANTWFSGPMGKGSVIETSSKGSDWEYPPPRSVEYFMLLNVCNYAGYRIE